MLLWKNTENYSHYPHLIWSTERIPLKILSTCTGTDRLVQTVQEQSDQGLHCLPNKYRISLVIRRSFFFSSKTTPKI